MLSSSAPGLHDCGGPQLGLRTHITTTGHFGCVACCLFVFTSGAKQRCCLVMHDAYFVSMLDHYYCFYKVDNWITYIQIFSYYSSSSIHKPIFLITFCYWKCELNFPASSSISDSLSNSNLSTVVKCGSLCPNLSVDQMTP